MLIQRLISVWGCGGLQYRIMCFELILCWCADICQTCVFCVSKSIHWGHFCIIKASPCNFKRQVLRLNPGFGLCWQLAVMVKVNVYRVHYVSERPHKYRKTCLSVCAQMWCLLGHCCSVKNNMFWNVCRGQKSIILCVTCVSRLITCTCRHTLHVFVSTWACLYMLLSETYSESSVCCIGQVWPFS